MKGDVAESLARAQTTLDTLLHFKQMFQERRSSLSQYQRDGKEVKPWDFLPIMAFAGLDRFIDRLKTVEARAVKALSWGKLVLVRFPIMHFELALCSVYFRWISYCTF